MAKELFSGYKAGFARPAMLALVVAAVLGVCAAGWYLAKRSTPAPAAPPAAASPVAAVAPAAAPAATASKPGTKSTKPLATRITESRPLWGELSAGQKKALQPLAGTWSSISDAQKRKWIAMSQNYATLPEAEQVRLHERMVEWVSLSPQQRSAARLNFAAAKSLSAEQKQEKWQAYQALPADEKKKLADGVTQRPVVGAATALKPVPKQKLAAVPTSSQNAKPAPRIAIAPVEVTPDAFMPEPDSSSNPAHNP